MKKKPRLSERDEAILAGLESGRSYEALAQEFEIDEANLRAQIGRILKDADPEYLLAKYPTIYMTANQTEGLDLKQDVLRLAKEGGMSKAMIDGVRRRIDARQGLAAGDLDPLTDRQLIHQVKKKIALALSYLDPFALASASAKDLQGVIDGLIKNSQLLEGKPTSITSIEDRRKLNELLPLLVKEAQRRGVTIDGTAERIDQEPKP